MRSLRHSLNMIKAVLFDFDETLQDRTAAFEKYMDTFLSEFCPDLSDDEIERRKEDMRITGNGGYVMANGYKNRDEWYDDLAQRWGWSDAPSGALLTAHYDSTFGDHNVIFPEAPVLLKELKDRGYTVGLITNGPSYLQHHKLEMSGLADYFDFVVVSGDVGVHKPDPAIFTYTAEKHGLNPAECVYVGDHPINDIQAGMQAGMNVIRVNKGWFTDKDLRPDVPTIDNILDVIKLI